MPTIKDIAELADVSICTVSRYLNNKITIKKDTEERIQNAIDQLGYVPNAVAQSLQRNSTSNVAVVLPCITSSYYSDMTGGISSELSKHNYNLFIYEIDHLAKSEAEILQLMRENMVAGVIFIGMSYDFRFKDSLSCFSRWNIPVVYANRATPYKDYPLVYPDFFTAGKLAARHLADTGKDHLALLSMAGYSSPPPHFDGFHLEVEELGLNKAEVLQCKVEETEIENCVDMLLRQNIDGVFVQNELLAVRVMKTLGKRGKKIPEDIAVVGFGNSLIGELSSPELSCIDLKNYELGVESAKVIMRQIQGEEFDPVTILEPFILRRSST